MTPNFVPMKRQLKLKCQRALEHTKRFCRTWDYSCIGIIAFLDGWQQGRESFTDGNEIIEVDAVEGDHQLSIGNFQRLEKEIINLPFKEALTSLLIHYKFDDLRVNEKDGIVSFQGTARKI